MLYVTTRNKVDAYTAYNTLCKDRAPDGGVFVPFQLPKLTAEQINNMKNEEFGQIIADILNLFFSAKLDVLDVDFCIGKKPVKLISMSHKIVIAETWHNSDQDFAKIVKSLSDRLLGENSGTCSNWVWIAVRIAVLFGLYGEMLRNQYLEDGQIMDVAVPAGDFTAPMAVWYAARMGLPAGMIICGCDNASVWDLLHHGELRIGEGVPADLERLVFETLGWEETRSYRDAIEKGGIYKPGEESAAMLSQNMFAAVVSGKRVASVINSIYRTNSYLLEPDGALAFAGLQDYRTGAGETRPALILTEKSPLNAADAVSAAMNIPVQELKSRTNPS